MHCLVIGKVWPEPDSTAAGRRIMECIHALQAEDCQITFATAAQPTEHSFRLETLGVSTCVVRANNSSFDTWVAELNPEVVLFDRFMVEEQFGWRVEKACPDALRVLDTSDLHCLREARRLEVEEGRPFDLFNPIALREIAAIHRSDLTLMIADYEMEVLRGEFNIPERQMAYWPFQVVMDRPSSLPESGLVFAPFEARRNFMIIGSFLHSPNLDAVRWCKQAVWPLIRERLPDVQLHCYGAYGDRYQAELHAPAEGFVYRGRAEDALQTMQQYRINCVPLRYGAGLKGKVFDGFQTGTPTVTTPIGAEGVVGDEDWGCPISCDPETFAGTAVKLYTDDELWAKVQACGQQIIRKRFNPDQWVCRLPELIDAAVAQREENRRRHFTGRMLRYHQHRSTEFMSRWIEAKNRCVRESGS